MIIKCRISGLQIEVQHIPSYVSSYHPIFYLPYSRLLPLYKRYFHRRLSPEESYLLYLALLNSTDSIIWSVPCSLKPDIPETIKLISSTIRQLISVIEKTNEITVPSFKQPSFRISNETSSLKNIHIYINEWAKNIESFHSGYREIKIKENIKKVERRLEYIIRSGLQSATTLATWADLNAEFPAPLREKYRYIISICYNKEKVFKIKTADIKEVRDYCLENIYPGSIYYHTLIECLEEGIKNKNEYLGYMIVEPSGIDEARNKLAEALKRRNNV